MVLAGPDGDMKISSPAPVAIVLLKVVIDIPHLALLLAGTIIGMFLVSRTDLGQAA